MKDLIKVGETINAVETMSSRQVAELTGKRHDNVMRDIKNLLDQGVGALNFELSSYKSEQNKNMPEYQLTKKGCLILASGYDAVLREKIIDRWEELENQNKFKVPTTFREALLLAAEQQEVIESQQKRIEIMAPKEEFFDAVADSKDAISMNDVAKVLGIKGMGRNNLFEFLRQNNILMNNNTPYQKYVDCGFFRVIEQSYMKNNEPYINTKTLVYQKGLDFIRKTINNQLNSK